MASAHWHMRAGIQNSYLTSCICGKLEGNGSKEINSVSDTICTLKLKTPLALQIASFQWGQIWTDMFEWKFIWDLCSHRDLYHLLFTILDSVLDLMESSRQCEVAVLLSNWVMWRMVLSLLGCVPWKCSFGMGFIWDCVIGFLKRIWTKTGCVFVLDVSFSVTMIGIGIFCLNICVFLCILLPFFLSFL